MHKMDKCMWCDKKAVSYCDHLIGCEAVGCVRDSRGKVTVMMTSLEEGVKAWTCDAPMCEDHAKAIGMLCGENPDTIDYCPYHADCNEQNHDTLVIFPREEPAIRRELYAAIRRSIIKQNNYQ
jgi:hypothetical protein